MLYLLTYLLTYLAEFTLTRTAHILLLASFLRIQCTIWTTYSEMLTQ